MQQDDSRQRSENTFRDIIENIPSGVLALDCDWHVVYLNHTAEKMLRRQREELLGKNIWQQFPDSVDRTFYKVYHEALKQQQNRVVEDYSEALGKWTQVIVYPSPNGLSIYFNDVTEQRLAEKKAREGELQYRQLLDRITDGFIALDKEFCYTYVNQKVGELVHRDPQSLIGKNVWKEFPDAIGSYTYRAFQTAMKEQRFVSNVDYYAPLNLWQENYIYPSPEGLSVFIKDISEQKKLEQELKRKEHNQQKQLIAASLEAQERERSYVGRELHDNVGQLLTAAKLTFEQAMHDPLHMAELLDRGMVNLLKAISESRKLAHQLVTPYFTANNFADELFYLLQTMLSAKGVEIVFDVAGLSEATLPEGVQLTIYRITQEQCTNIIKYAAATKVWFVLAKTQEGIELEIRDNGQGISRTTAKGIGLKNMEARLALLQGSLQIQSAKGAGFSLQVNLPNEVL